jgi:dienelactone hydrolase
MLGALATLIIWCCTYAEVAAAENITIPASGSTPTITGYLMHPNGSGPFPGVLVLHGCQGYGSLEKATVNELASLGYVALAIDTLKPQGLQNACKDRPAFRVSASYAVAALAWLATQPLVAANRLGIVGYSMGGIEILDVIDPFQGAQQPPAGLRVAVAYYPACTNRDGNVSVPLLILNGSADDWAPPTPCQDLAETATAAGKQVQIVTYPGATHSFNQPSGSTRIYEGHTLTYDPTAAADADARMKAFLAKYLTP